MKQQAQSSALYGLSLACALACLIAPDSCGAQSLYDESTFRPLTGDRKAYRVGDVLTIQVLENASAAASADSGTQRKSDLSVGRRQHELNLAASSEFDGGGRTARTGRLLTQLSVHVVAVLANGDMRVAGEQLLVINREQQRIRIEGQVRAQDISEGNVVLSNRLAEARIDYVGAGDMTESQRAAWWHRVMNWLGL
ncbi:MAG: flagellar basal body L-ring protein FlgH [Burkholderiaceae bacterium]|nr:flagellar basal body L-ring protein FlgH [Burkholderiaceae bacterium]